MAPIQLVAIGLVALIFTAAILAAARTNSAWRHAAQELGLRIARTGPFGKREMTGELGGHDVTIDTVTRGSGNHSQTYTRLRVRFPSAGIGYKLTKQGAFSQVAQFFGREDHELGDEEFDRAVIVKGPDAESIAQHLTPRRRLLVQRLFARNADCVVRDGELESRTPGVITSPPRLRSLASQLVRVAEGLAGFEQELDQAVEAQRAGDLQSALDALKQAREMRGPEQVPDPDLEVVEGDVLLAAGRPEEAAEAFERARAELPDDQELAELSELTRAVPAPAAPAPELLPLDVAAVCGELFLDRRLSSETARVFAERYEGRGVRWSGTLERVSRYYSDLAFGRGPGTRAVFKIHSLATDSYVSRDVQAVLQLPESAEAELRDRRGETFEFTGRLIRCDAFVRNLFVADGALV